MRQGRALRAGAASALAAGLGLAACAPPPPVPEPAERSRPSLFEVDVEEGRRPSSGRGTVAYDLYLPRATAGLPEAPWPAVVLAHGFARSRERHAGTARHLAERGFVVLVADLVSLLGGEGARETNVVDARGHVEWLRVRAATPGDALWGLVDPERLALAGFSAGGAVAFEAAAGARVRAVVLLDAVPWRRTLEAARTMPGTRLLSLRSEPSSCNAKGSVRELLAALPFGSDDVRVVGATHCDPEDPTDGACRLFCGGTSEEARGAYRRLLHLFLADALGAPPVGDEADTFAEAVRRGVEAGTLAVEKVGPAREPGEPGTAVRSRRAP